VTVRILVGDVRQRLADLADESVHCVVTSPPYFGLRDYGTASWEGGHGHPACDHLAPLPGGTQASGLGAWETQSQEAIEAKVEQYRGTCAKCGAQRVDSQIGLEETPWEYLDAMVEIFREIRRVLRQDGTLWLNMGDSYANDTKWGGASGGVMAKGLHGATGVGRGRRRTGLKPKDMMMMPARLAIALQDDGWWVRRDVIWSKPNPMPESIEDRPTTAHEYLYLLSRSERYFYDAVAIMEPVAKAAPSAGRSSDRTSLDEVERGQGGNKRSVWTIATAPFDGEFCKACKVYYPGREYRQLRAIKVEGKIVGRVCRCGASDQWLSHFATFPPALVEPCILAGTSERGCCPDCGAPWQRVTETNYRNPGNRTTNGARSLDNRDQTAGFGVRLEKQVETTGWAPGCQCRRLVDGPEPFVEPGVTITPEPVPCTVLDPFSGAGTTALVADRLGRSAIGIELNPDYAMMSEQRLGKDAGLFAAIEREAEPPAVAV
jgi:DNA modification methylase